MDNCRMSRVYRAGLLVLALLSVGPATAQAARPIRVTAVAFSPDGAWMAAGYLDGTIRLWSVWDDKPGLVLHGEGPVKSLALTKNRRMLACFGHAGNGGAHAMQWQLPRTGLQAIHLSFDGNFRLAKFSPDGKFLAVASEDPPSGNSDIASHLQLVETESPGLPRRFPVKGRINALNFSPDGSLLAVLSTGPGGIQNVLLDSRDSPRDRWLVHTSPISTLTFSPDGKMLAGLTASGVVFLDSRTGKFRREIPHDYPPVLAGFARRMLTTVGQSTHNDDPRDNKLTVQWWNPVTGRPVRTLDLSPGKFTVLSLSPDGQVLATGAANGGVRLWPLSGG